MSKEKLLSLFPTGLLATTLDLDKSASEIDFDLPFITPEILNFLAEIINNRHIPDTIPDNLLRTADYLQLDLLSVLSNPEYKNFHLQYPNINLLDKASLDTSPTYDQVMTYAIQHQYTELFEYMLENTNGENHVEDARLLGLSVIGNFTEGVRALLQERKVDPKYVAVPLSIVKDVFPSKAGEIEASAFMGLGIPEVLRYALGSNIDIFNLLLPYF